MSKDKQAEQTNPADAAVDTDGGQQAQQGQQEEQNGDDGNVDLGFPADTALDDMTDEQRVAYWKNQSKVQQRKHEAEVRERKAEAARLEASLDELRLKSLSAEERAAEEAVRTARVEAAAEARVAILPRLAVAELRARGLSAEDAAERVEFLDLSKLVDESGELVAERLDRLVPAAPAGLSPQQVFHSAGGTPSQHRTSLGADAVAARAEQIKNKHKHTNQ